MALPWLARCNPVYVEGTGGIPTRLRLKPQFLLCLLSGQVSLHTSCLGEQRLLSGLLKHHADLQGFTPFYEVLRLIEWHSTKPVMFNHQDIG